MSNTTVSPTEVTQQKEVEPDVNIIDSGISQYKAISTEANKTRDQLLAPIVNAMGNIQLQDDSGQVDHKALESYTFGIRAVDSVLKSKEKSQYDSVKLDLNNKDSKVNENVSELMVELLKTIDPRDKPKAIQDTNSDVEKELEQAEIDIDQYKSTVSTYELRANHEDYGK